MALEELWPLLVRHLLLTGSAVAAAALAGVPLGMLLTRTPVAAPAVLMIVNVAQTLPSLALLGFLIPVLGIGFRPALVALFLYALLPIVRGTYTGIRTVGPDLEEIAEALGLTSWQRLRLVELPLAMPHILAGVRTSTVITVGTATLAALIGAGGLGVPIFRGIAMVSPRLILAGAVPSAVLAVTLDALLHAAERALTPRGLRRAA